MCNNKNTENMLFFKNVYSFHKFTIAYSLKNISHETAKIVFSVLEKHAKVPSNEKIAIYFCPSNQHGMGPLLDKILENSGRR